MAISPNPTQLSWQVELQYFSIYSDTSHHMRHTIHTLMASYIKSPRCITFLVEIIQTNCSPLGLKCNSKNFLNFQLNDWTDHL